jgi:malonyl-CoA O-methyltransferase
MKRNTSTEVHFTRAAAVYHARAELQRAVAERLLQYQSRPIQARRILELGCGTGFLTGHLLETFPEAQIDALDISASMIEQARRVVAANPQIHWHVCDVWDYHDPAAYDLITSSSSLQWMQPLDELFCRLSSMLGPGGRLLCSLMVEGTLGELHRLRGEVAPHKIPHQRLPTVAATVAFLERAGFRVSRSGQDILQTRYDRFEDLIRTIRELGFTGGPLGTSTTLLTRGELKRLAERYTVECALPGGQVGASYVIYSFEAVKAVTS